MKRHLQLRFAYWLVCWVRLADDLVEIASFTCLDLGFLVVRATAWLERLEQDAR